MKPMFVAVSVKLVCANHFTFRIRQMHLHFARKHFVGKMSLRDFVLHNL